MKRKKKKPTKSRVDVRTIVITAIVDFLVGLALLLIDKVLIQGYNHNSTIKSSQPTQKRRFLTKGGVFIPREHKALPGRPSMVGKAAR